MGGKARRARAGTHRGHGPGVLAVIGLFVCLSAAAATTVAGAGEARPGGPTTSGDQTPRAKTTCFDRTPTILAVRGERTIGTAGNDVIVGTDGPDRILGGGGNDRICGAGGNDTLLGQRGDDRISGGEGRDRLDGGRGNDRLLGGRNRDIIFGRRGADRIDGGKKADRCHGGPGDDELIACGTTVSPQPSPGTDQPEPTPIPALPGAPSPPPAPMPSPTTPAATPTPSSTPTATPAATPSPSSTPTPSSTPVPSVTPATPPTAGAGLVSFTFDDGWASQISVAAPLLAQYGVRGTFYINNGFFGYEGYASPADVVALHAAGHQIGSHTTDHPHLPTLSPDAVMAQLVDSKAALEALIGAPVLDFATPYGEYDASVLAQIMQVYRSHRGVSEGLNTVGGTDVSRLVVRNVLASTPPSLVESWMNEANASRTWLILVYHQVTDPAQPYGTTPGDLNAHLQTARSRGLTIVTVAQGLGLVGAG